MKTLRRHFGASLLLLTFFIAAPNFANQYDKDEETLRAAKKLADIDEAERDAARKRYDEEHPSGGGGNPVSGFLCLFLGIGIPTAILYKAWTEKKN